MLSLLSPHLILHTTIWDITGRCPQHYKLVCFGSYSYESRCQDEKEPVINRDIYDDKMMSIRKFLGGHYYLYFSA